MNGRPAWLIALALAAAASLPPAWSGESDTVLPMAQGLSAAWHAPILLPRPNAPWPIVVALTMRSPALRTGMLGVDVSEGRHLLCRWTSDERVLVSGVTTFPVLLPPMSLANEHDQLTCTLRWFEKGGVVELGRMTEPMSSGEHLLYLALCLPLAATESARHVQRDLALEFLQRHVVQDEGDRPAGPLQQNQSRPRLRTVPVHLSEEECPETALAWCAYDMAVIVGDRLQGMKARHIAALEHWVLAGGSCCLVCAGEPPAGISDLVSRAITAGGGRSGPSAGGHARLRYGLGRIVVVREGAAQQGGGEDDASDWRASAAFLWKLRKAAADGLAATGSWDVTEQAPENPAYTAGSRYWSYDRPLVFGSMIYQLLWPEHVHAVPFAIILAVFITFILLIGPGEWFLLGWLRARRFTWVVFPALAILCTCSMVLISRSYLGNDDVRQRLEVVDVGPGGQLLRCNRCELVFTGATKDIVDDCRDAIRCPLDLDQSRNYPGSMPQRDEAAKYRGNLPGRYSVTQTVAQWSPCMVRELSLSPAPLPWALDLDAIHQPADAEASVRRWIGAVADHAAAVMIQQGHVTRQWGDQPTLSHFMNGNRTRAEYLFQAINGAPEMGWFGLFSSISPAGGAMFDDFPVLDASDPDEFAIVCIQHREGSWWLVRRVFHADPGGPGTTK